MPQYTWKCGTCEIRMVVINPIVDASKPPTTGCLCNTPNWIKMIGSTPIHRSKNWGSKGDM